MSESNIETISIHVSTEPKSNGERPPETPSRLKIPRPSLIAFLSILILFTGWGAWRYWGSMKLLDDSESVTDLDGIEAVTPLFEPDKQGNSSTSGLGEPSPFSAKNGKIREASFRGGTTDPDSNNRNVSHAEVWLTGTIEVDESDERIPLPQRISGGPSESSNLR
jgi:hypothetical protein